MATKVAGNAVTIKGLRELQAKLRAMDGQSQKKIRLVLNEAADVIVQSARPLIPHRSGKAAASLKAQSGQREAKVVAGGARVPYYGWLDFGGSVGRRNSVHRPFIKEGRYIYPTFSAKHAEVMKKIEEGIDALIRESGLA